MSQKVRVLVVDDSALMRKLIPQALADDPDDRDRRHRDGRPDRPPQDRRAAPARRDARSRNAAHGRDRNAAQDHGQASRAGHRGQRAHRGRRFAHPESALARRFRFRHQAAGRCSRPPPPDRIRVGAEDQSRRILGRAENDPYGALAQAQGAAPLLDEAALAVAHCRRSESPRADQTRCSISSRSFRKIFRGASSWCSTCRKASPKCSPAAWTNPRPSK